MSHLKKLANRWFIEGFSGMAQGLFCTLIAGTILAQIASIIGTESGFGFILNCIASIAKTLMGAGIGVGIASYLKSHRLVVFTAGVTGFVGAFADKLMLGEFNLVLGLPGNPIGAFVVALLTIELARFYAGKTKLDIILIPLGMMIVSVLGIYIAYPFIYLVNSLGELIALATEITPFFMGIIIAVSMGILLTMPTSSAAIWISIASGMEGDAILIAGGASVVGCACHMVGFAVASFKDNGVNGIISQGIGTSMLQIPNIMKKPIIMLPQIISSAILGPIATCVFALKCGASGGGMGTSGLVGIMGVIEANSGMPVWELVLAIGLLMIILPSVISFIVSEFMYKKGFIKLGDQKI